VKVNWDNLTKEERSVYMHIQMSHSNQYGGRGYLPDDCSDCGSCGQPMLGVGICSSCYQRWKVLDDKLRGKES